MDPYLKAQLKQVLAFATPTGVDAAGQATHGSTATCFARVEVKYREMPMYGGVEERTSHMIILSESWALTEAQTREALFWLPGNASTDAGAARRAKSVKFCIGERGELDHVEVGV